MTLPTRTYDILKWITLVVLPALATFYLALAQTWGLPYPTEVAGTIAAIDVFLATLLGISIGYFEARKDRVPWESTQDIVHAYGDWILSLDWYKTLTWVAQILLPATAALYLALGQFWLIPHVDGVVATIMALDTFLGMLLGFSSGQFMKSIATTCVIDGDMPKS